eukprot:m.216198 g.216198  ORF g.216198 m.216198 type:complete len:529 (-) comp33204_c2_seq2:217-1803(-)
MRFVAKDVLLLGCLLACSISIALANPFRFTGNNCKGAGVCWLPVGSGITIMGKSASTGTAITFSPALIGGKYTPGQTYTLGMSGKSSSAQHLAGATKGSWQSQSCSCGSTTTGADSGSWTAPGVGSGDVTIGMTYATGYGSSVFTTVTDYAEGAPATTTLPPTKPPTPQPTILPTKQPTARPSTVPTQQPSTSSPTTSTPTVSPTINCVCLGLVGGDDAYCAGAYDGATLVSKQQCENDAKCKFGLEAGFASPSYPECSLISKSPTSSTPTATPTPAPSPSPTSAPQSSSPTRAPSSPQPSMAPQPSTRPPTAAPNVDIELVTFSGYITDTICLVKVNVVDFQNITTDAPKHTRACLLLDYCIESGYTLLDYDDTTKAYSAKYQVASGDVSKVVAVFNSLTCSNNISVVATGTVKGAASFAHSDYAGDPDFWFTQGRNETFGDVFEISTITGTCGGDISLATTTTIDPDVSSSTGSDTELDTGAITTVAIAAAAAGVIIVVFEVLGQQISGKVKLDEPTGPPTTHFGL